MNGAMPGLAARLILALGLFAVLGVCHLMMRPARRDPNDTKSYRGALPQRDAFRKERPARPAVPRPTLPTPPPPTSRVPRPRRTPETRPTTPRPADGFPGLAAATLLRSLEFSGLPCTSAAIRDGTVSWSCSATNGLLYYEVTIVGNSTESIRFVSSSITQSGEFPSEPLATHFLAPLAGAVCAGDDPVRARQWVTENTGREATTTIGTVRLELSGSLRKRSLTMRMEKP